MLATRSLVFALFVSLGLTQLQAVPGPACNPSTQKCPPKPAVGGNLTVDFTQGASNEFYPWAGPNATYNASGAYLTMSQAGDTPTLSSTKYIMFGHVKIVMSKCRGGGTVTDIVLQSDVLDEVDFNSWGSKGGITQTNWFGMGLPGNTDRVLMVPDGDEPDGFNTYEVDWDENRILWTINGNTVRELSTTDVPGTTRYPQTPMAVRLGIWAPNGNDTSAVQWAGGQVDWSGGPYSMIIKSVEMVDYSTGGSYNYTNNYGNLNSISSNGGTINGNNQAESTLGSPTNTTSPNDSPSSNNPSLQTLPNSTSPTNIHSDDGLSTGAKAGIAVSAIVAGLASLVVIFLAIVLSKRKARSHRAREMQGPGVVID